MFIRAVTAFVLVRSAQPFQSLSFSRSLFNRSSQLARHSHDRGTQLSLCCTKRPFIRPRAARRKFHGVRTPRRWTIILGPFRGPCLRWKSRSEKAAISRRSFFHFWRPSSRPSPHRTAVSDPARQEACKSEEFAFGLWWPLRGGVGVFWLQWPPKGLLLLLPLWLSSPVYAQSSDSNASARSKPLVLSVQSSTDTVTSVFNTLQPSSPQSQLVTLCLLKTER